MDTNRGLIVRRTARHDLVLPVMLRIDADHAEIVRFGPRAGDHDGWLDADLMDIGLAGAGIVLANFLPRNTLVRLRVMSLNPDDRKVLLECSARVMRVVMTDRRPAYMLGLAFENFDESETDTVREFIDAFVEPTGDDAQGEEDAA